MNFPIGFLSVINSIIVITPRPVGYPCESKCWEFGPLVAKVDSLLHENKCDEVWSFIMTLFRISSHHTSKHASRSNGSGLVLRILIQTSLRFVLSSTQECENLFFFHNFLIFDVVTSTIPFQFFKDVEFLLILGENVEVLGHAEVPLL